MPPKTDMSGRPFMCPVKGCGKGYEHASHLRTHTKRAHVDPKDFPFKCDLDPLNCTASFPVVGDLNEHKRVHRRTEADVAHRDAKNALSSESKLKRKAETAHLKPLSLFDESLRKLIEEITDELETKYGVAQVAISLVATQRLHQADKKMRDEVTDIYNQKLTEKGYDVVGGIGGRRFLTSFFDANKKFDGPRRISLSKDDMDTIIRLGRFNTAELSYQCKVSKDVVYYWKSYYYEAIEKGTGKTMAQLVNAGLKATDFLDEMKSKYAALENKENIRE